MEWERCHDAIIVPHRYRSLCGLCIEFRLRLFRQCSGDEPLLDPEDLNEIIRHARNHPNLVINGYAPIESEEEYRSEAHTESSLGPIR